MTKEYRNGEKILDENGNYIDNPDFDEDKNYLVGVHNEQDLIYYSDIYFWDDVNPNPEKLQVIMDTGSSWLWAPSSECVGCPSDSSISHSYLDDRGDGIKKIQYGSGGISGDIVRATVSLDQNRQNAISDYKMLEVTAAALPGLEGSRWDGILGLLPTAISGSKLFVTELFKAGILSEDSFGVYYTDTRKDSEITFGGFDKRRVKSIADFSFIDLYDNMHWSAKLGSAKYGNVTLDAKAASAILDSGTSLILMTHDMFADFKATVSVGRKCGVMSVYYGCYCNSKSDFDPLFFKLGNYEYKTSPETYVVETRSSSNKFCYFLIQGSGIKKNTILLGDSFLRNYYVYHDVTHRRMGLYGDYMVYSKPAGLSKEILIMIGIAAGAVLFLV